MTESDFEPSVKNCKNRGCDNLIWEIFAGRRRMICAVDDRVPGNLSECPLDAAAPEEEKEEDPFFLHDCFQVIVDEPTPEGIDDEEKREAPPGGILHNSISPYNSRRDITVTRFNDGIATAGRCDRGDYQEIISSIVKAARLNGYQIPEADI